MILFILPLIIQQIYAAQFPFTEYTHVSRAFDGTPCLTGCSPENDCVINWKWEKRDCRRFEVAPIYYTARQRVSEKKYCLTNCGYFGEKYEWCIVTEDLQWDYCSSYKSTTFLPSQEPVALTRFGQTCSGPCYWYDIGQSPGQKYYWCHYMENNQEKWEYCAPPTRPRVPVLSDNYFIGNKKKGNCDGFLLYVNTCPDNITAHDAADDYVSGLADAIEGSTLKNTFVHVHTVVDPTVPIDKYSTVVIRNMTVPAVIRAHITKDHLGKPAADITEGVKRKLREIMQGTPSRYQPGRLIGAQLGGTNEEYNVVPRSVHWKYTELWDIELAIKNWIVNTEGSVDMTVVVFYKDENTPIPLAFGISLIYRNDDNSVFVECRDKIHHNNF